MMPVRVRLVERLTYLQHAIDGVLDGERAVLLQDPREVAALEVLHHHEGRVPSSSVPTSSTRTTCSLSICPMARASRSKRRRISSDASAGPQELDRDDALELHVPRGDDDARPAFADEPLEAVLLGEDVTNVERYSAERPHAVRSAVQLCW